MMPSCAFVSQGRFGNNIFQYIACKITCLKFQYSYVPDPSHLTRPGITIFEDTSFKQWKTVDTVHTIDDWNKLDIELPDGDGDGDLDVLVHGFFQDMEFINRNIDRIQSIFVSSNTDMCYETYRVCDIIQDIPLKPGPQDLVLHVRLDDFYYAGGGVNVLSCAYYREALDRMASCGISCKKAWIVIDQIRNPTEHAYIQSLIRLLHEYGFITCELHQKSMIEDWNFCRYAKYIISSNSTFAWTAMIVGSPLFATIPNTHYYTHQVLVPLKHIPICYILDAQRNS